MRTYKYRNDDGSIRIDVNYDDKLIDLNKRGDDKPDVEFNDDGSVHINTPGDYNFRSTYDSRSATVRVYAWQRSGERGWRQQPDIDDPALGPERRTLSERFSDIANERD